ncbi:F-box domain containing protein [Tanacetum coccineum]
MSFEYVGRRREVILEEVDSLKKAVIHPEDMLQQKISPTLGKTVCKWFGGISYVDSLSLNLYFVQELDEVEAKGVLTRHLKRVEFVELNGEEHKLGITRLLLKQANELEEMVFSWCNEVSYHEKSVETMNEVSKY